MLIFGLVAGAVSTTVGSGGGQLMVIALSAVYGPLSALTWTGPALLLGNLHRLSMFRAHLEVRSWRRFAVGAVPGALVGGLLVPWVPAQMLTVGIAAVAVLAVLRRLLGGLQAGPRWLLPGGAVVGFVAATAGGAGVIAGPLWKGVGVKGDGYIASMAAGAATIHVARLLGYGVSGMLDGAVLSQGAVLTVGVLLGNLVGRQVRRAVPSPWVPKLELGAIVGSALLAVAFA